VRFPLRWLLLVVAPVVCGCHTASYYTQAVRGQYQIVARQQPIERLLADPQTPETLKEKLQLVQQLRAFAGKELALPVNGQYRRYADLHRPYAIWNVYAAPEFSLEPKTWWYLVVGRLDYRGFFAERDARDCAQRLAAKGFDTSVGGVEAYSTLGWFKDPVLNTFVHHSEPELAEIIFHELAHQRVFAHGDTEFNEAFATAVGQEGVRRWLRAKSDRAAYENYAASLRHHEQFERLIVATRQKLQTLYGDTLTPGGKIKAAKQHPRPVEQLRAEKQRILDGLRREWEKLRSEWDVGARLDDWLADGVNNAELNSEATYYGLVPAFDRLLAANGGDLEKFFAAVTRLAKLPKAERHRQLMDAGAASEGNGQIGLVSRLPAATWR
jgi:predicted aminopeptidase